MTSEQIAEMQRYLAALDRACVDLPSGRRDELVAEIRAHIEGSLVGVDEIDDAELRSLLDAIGSPEDIAAAARVENAPSSATNSAGGFGLRDISTVVLLLAGGILAGLGWVVGAVLLWTSQSWRTRDKLIGTLLVPGGLVGAAMFVGVGTFAAGQTCVATSNGPTQCTGFAFPPAVGIPLMTVILLAPIFSMIWLVRTHRAGGLADVVSPHVAGSGV